MSKRPPYSVGNRGKRRAGKDRIDNRRPEAVADAEAAPPSCDTCRDTGQVCLGCNAADGECTCPGGPELDACPDCGGRP